MRDWSEFSPQAQRRLLDDLTAAAGEAAAVIAAGGAPSGARLKPDGSPVTDADKASEAVILAALARLLPSVPVVSEETASAPAPASSSLFVLVDPLDGTREFIAGRDEFTVNIAVIAQGEPVLGIVAAPALACAWRGLRGQGAERAPLAGAAPPIAIRARPWPEHAATALVSRSHLDAESAAFLDRIPDLARRPCGSALKFCRIAEGEADLYPRLAPTREWDIAAGHAVLAAAGGIVCAPDGAPIRYGNAAGGFEIPAFIAGGDPAALVRLLRRV